MEQLIFSAQTQTVINSVIDQLITMGHQIDALADRLTKKQLVNYINTTSKALLETQIARRSLAKSLVVFLHELRKAKGREHYQVIRDRVKQEYNMTTNDYSSLRYWGLIKPDDLDEQNGYWQITEDGNRFLDNELALPKSVTVHNNRVIDRNKKLVKVENFNNLDFVGYQKIRRELTGSI